MTKISNMFLTLPAQTLLQQLWAEMGKSGRGGKVAMRGTTQHWRRRVCVFLKYTLLVNLPCFLFLAHKYYKH